MQNLAPGAASRLGLGADSCTDPSRADPLLDLRVRRGGPYTEKKAYDLLVQCEAGLLSVTGSPEAPAKAGISIADIAAGMYAYTGILTALIRRTRTARRDHRDLDAGGTG